MVDLDAPATRRDLLRLRTLVLSDSPTLEKWKLLADSLVSSQYDLLQIKRMVNDDFPGAILKTLELWQSEKPAHATLSAFMALLRDHKLNYLAERVKEDFTKPVAPTTDRPSNTTPHAPSSSSTDTKTQQPHAAKSDRKGTPGADLKRQIASAMPDIINNVGNLSQLLAILVSEDTITVQELQLVQSMPSKSDQLSSLTLFFARKPPSAWERFKEALTDTGNGHVAARI